MSAVELFVQAVPLLSALPDDVGLETLKRLLTPPDLPDVRPHELNDILNRLRVEAGNPTIRGISRKAGLSPATVSRAFNGSTIPTLNTVNLIATTLRANPSDRDRCRAAWLAAMRHAEAAARKVHRNPVADLVDTPLIVVSGGTVHLADEAGVAGKTIVVNGGEVFLSAKAAQKAAGIVVNGGEVFVGTDAAERRVRRDDPQPLAADSDRPEHGSAPTHQAAHLRRVQ